MQIVLTYAELNACRYWGTLDHKQLLVDNREHTRAGHVVSLPAIAWRTLADRMRPEAFHPVTGRHRKTRNARDGVPATRSALQKIESTIAHTIMHPAFRGEAEEGVHGEVLIAWKDEGVWSLYPVPDAAPVYFVPEVQNHPQVGAVTAWRQRDSFDDDVPGLFPDPLDHSGWTRSDQSAAEHS